MKKYISPEVALIKELSNDFCEGLEASVTDSKQMGYVQLESVEDDMEDQKNVNAFFGDIKPIWICITTLNYKIPSHYIFLQLLPLATRSAAKSGRAVERNLKLNA